MSRVATLLSKRSGLPKLRSCRSNFFSPLSISPGSKVFGAKVPRCTVDHMFTYKAGPSQLCELEVRFD